MLNPTPAPSDRAAQPMGAHRGDLSNADGVDAALEIVVLEMGRAPPVPFVLGTPASQPK